VIQRSHMLERPRIPNAARYGVGIISRKDPKSNRGESSETSRYASASADDDKVRSLWRHRGRSIRFAAKKPTCRMSTRYVRPGFDRGLRLTIGGNLTLKFRPARMVSRWGYCLDAGLRGLPPELRQRRHDSADLHRHVRGRLHNRLAAVKK
jgi:hypothetical protein